MGGHRFAPTGMLLRTATTWVYLDAPSLRRIVHREGDPADIPRLYRGCATFVTPAVQAMERVVFAETGWQWLDTDRRGIDGVGEGNVRVEALMSAQRFRQ